MFGFLKRNTLAGLLAVGLLAVLLPLSPAGATSPPPSAGYLPFPSGASIYISQGNCVNGSTGIPNPTHCDQYGHDAWDFVYARNGQPTDSEGRPVVAAVAGMVLYSYDAAWGDSVPTDCRNSGSGNFVVVDDGDGTYTQYVHLEDGSVAVSAGDSVVLGDAIGSIGSSGESTAAHLHFSWATDVDHCGVGISVPGSFIDQLAPVPVTGDVLTSNNPGPMTGQLLTDGADTYVVAGGAPILLPDCDGLYGAPACSQARLVSSLQGFAAHPVNGTDLVAEPSGLAYRVVGGAPLPIPDCNTFSTCGSDAVTVSDSALSTPDARLAGSPAEWSFLKTGNGNTVWQYASGCLRSSTIWFDPTYATLVPGGVLGLWPGCPLPEPNVSITKGSPNGSNIFFSLWDRDASVYGVASSRTAPQAAVVVSFAGVPKSASPITANVTTKASRSCSQTVALWNWKSDSWNTIDVAPISTSYIVRSDIGNGASSGAYVKGSGTGVVRLRLSCQRGKGGFDYSVDWTQIRYPA